MKNFWLQQAAFSFAIKSQHIDQFWADFNASYAVAGIPDEQIFCSYRTLWQPDPLFPDPLFGGFLGVVTYIITIKLARGPRTLFVKHLADRGWRRAGDDFEGSPFLVPYADR